MRILITFFPLNNLGGIVNNHESLIAGFLTLGHSVTNRLLVWRQDVNGGDGWNRRLECETAASGIPYDQERGWAVARIQATSLQGQEEFAAMESLRRTVRSDHLANPGAF
jgi:hypothetical protein